LIEVRKYNSEDKELWNEFVASAKNATFLFNRNFMDYHKDRFEDYSLLCFKRNELVGIFPANHENEVVFTHKGLSYGGLITNKILKLKETSDVLVEILKFINTQGKTKLIYKKPPIIYQELEGLQMNNILYMLKAKCYRVDAYLVIDSNTYNINRNRKRAINRAKKNNVNIQENKFKEFWNELLEPNLNKRYNVRPVHTLDEMLLLKNDFKKNIHCYTAHIDNEVKAGVVVFEYDDIVHLQYSSASNTRNEDGAIDFLFDYIFNKYLSKKYISLGSCSEGVGNRKINNGLLSWKESFGAISIPQEFYEIDTNSFTLIDNVFS